MSVAAPVLYERRRCFTICARHLRYEAGRDPGMADDDHKAPEEAPRAGRARRRPAPTIDLKATEVASEAPEEPPAPEPPSSPPDSNESARQTATPPPPETTAPSEPPKPEPEVATPPPRSSMLWPMLGAAVAGGALGLAAMLFLWGVPSGDDRQDARIAQLETKVRDLAAREVPPSADPKTVASLTQRVAQLEARPAPPSAPNPQLDDRLAALEQRIKSLSDAADAKAATVQAAGAQAAGADRAVASLSERITALERTAQTLQKDITQQQAALAKQRGAHADERAVRLAVVAETLKAAVARGERYRAELDAAKALAADQTVLAPLGAFADTGVPTSAALSRRLHALLPALRRTVEPKATKDGGFLQRLQANAERLVRIQPVGEQSGDDAGAVLTRVDADASRGDVAGALTELAKLPPAVRAPAEDWIKTARAREAAVDASRRFAAAQIGALAGPSE
jgi:hypothetical protein